MDDRYLWDRTGPPDREVERLEKLLGGYRSRRDLDLPPRRFASARRLFVAAAALLLAAAGAWLARAAPSSWTVRRLEGAPTVAEKRIVADGRLRVGESLRTDAASRARVEIGRIGGIEIGPSSRVRLLASGWRDQRIALERGRIHATVSAPPRLFAVETASATAVDLGCEYTLSVTEDGTGTLSVARGWVELDWAANATTVPAGFACVTTSGRGPGLPLAVDAPPPLAAGVARFDFEGAGTEAVGDILSAARPRDALTLWHLLGRTQDAERERVYERLAMLVPPPPGVSRGGVLALDPATMDLWRFEMGIPLSPGRLSFWKALRARLAR